MKNLANCDPIDFLIQTGKIRKKVSDWLDMTRILEIRKNKPDIPKDATKEETAALLREQARKNLSEMLTAILDEHPAETAELLGLCCFVKPEDLRNHKMTEFLGAAAEIIGDKDVLDFFISLTNLAQTNISTSAKP